MSLKYFPKTLPAGGKGRLRFTVSPLDHPRLVSETAVPVFVEWVSNDGLRDVVESTATAQLLYPRSDD